MEQQNNATSDYASTATSARAFEMPPGFAGVLACALLRNAYIPIPEVASVAALAMLAGLGGRSFRTPTGADLALYINFIASSGGGKDTMHKGIPALLRYSMAGTLNQSAPVDRFIAAEKFSHGNSLHKRIVEAPGFLALQREWGQTIKKAAEGDQISLGIVDKLTEAYNADFLGGMKYTTDEKNRQGVAFPAMSWLGESTPGKFDAVLSSNMAEDGFLSRTVTIRYDRPIPHPNESPALHLEQYELDYWKELVSHCLANVERPVDAITVQWDAEQERKFKQHEHECIAAVNATKDEFVRQAFTRAALKSLKIASILAVADDFKKPTIRPEHSAWARTLIRIDQQNFLRRNESGDIGGGDHAYSRKLTSIVTKYLTEPVAAGYRVPETMRLNGIVPHKYLQQKVQRSPPFNSHKLGENMALAQTLKSMMDSGYMIECKKDDIVKGYDFHGKCYRVLDLPN